MKLNLFIVTKPILHRTIRFAWTQDLLAMLMLFYLVKAFIVFHANAEEEEENDKDAHESDADEYDNDVDSQSNGYESAEGQTFAIGNISKQMSS